MSYQELPEPKTYFKITLEDLIEVSNDSHITRVVHKSLQDKLSQKEKEDFLMWLRLIGYNKEGINKPEYKFDVNRIDLYDCTEPSIHTRTKLRLIEMAELGLEEVGTACFGVRDVVSGLYIERVWTYSDKDFKDYLNWMKTIIGENKKSI